MRSDSEGNLLKKFKGTAGRGSWKRGCRMIYRPRRSNTTLKGVTYSRSAATKQKPMKMAVALVPSQATKRDEGYQTCQSLCKPYTQLKSSCNSDSFQKQKENNIYCPVPRISPTEKRQQPLSHSSKSSKSILYSSRNSSQPLIPVLQYLYQRNILPY